MKSCNQNIHQNIYEHGESVQSHLKQIIQFIKEDGYLLKDWILPNWLHEYKEHIKSKLLNQDDLLLYALFHDCGKPHCKTIDAEGKQHFQNHAKVSAETWRLYDDNEQIARLIEMDMDIHLLKSSGIDEFSKRPEAISLLITGLAELHSNSKMFGGIESASFKIKLKHLNKIGKQICLKLFS